MAIGSEMGERLAREPYSGGAPVGGSRGRVYWARHNTSRWGFSRVVCLGVRVHNFQRPVSTPSPCEANCVGKFKQTQYFGDSS